MRKPILRWRKLARHLARLAAACVGLYLLAALALSVAGLVEEGRRADVGVVFGNKVEPSGEPSPSLASRLDVAVELYEEGIIQAVIVSGGFGKEGWDEAEVMAAYLAQHGVPPEVIYLDREGNNTYRTAENSAVIAREQGFKSFVVISHFYHLPRARLTFARFGLTPVTAAHSRRFVARDFYFGLLREVIAYPSYLLREYPE